MTNLTEAPEQPEDAAQDVPDPQQARIQRSESVALIKFRIAFAHVAMLGIFFVPATRQLVLATALSFFVRVFAWEGGSHRYFAHRSYRTSRLFQFLIAFVAAASGHRGPLWWASQHRQHHRHTDQAGDPHSPVTDGILHAYVGWACDPRYVDTDLDQIRDFARYPELVWLNRYHYTMPYVLMVGVYFLGETTTLFGRTGLGLSAVVWTFFFGMVLSLHAAFVVNGFMHNQKLGIFHSRRYHTPDTTTNSWFWCVPTMGASWHNNHHRYMNSVRAGHRWWELDLTYLILRALSLVGVVWDLHQVPSKVMAEGKPRAPQPVTSLRANAGE
jgi:stearoyl-CoA desaturase (delta-9 desaturase)